MVVINNTNIEQNDLTAVTLGTFDGMHLGHKKLIETTKQYAEKNSLRTVMFSFYPHPVSVIKKDKSFYTILSREEKIKTAEEMGIDIYIEYPFSTEFASLEPYDFLKTLCNKLKCKVLIVGNDYCFGKGRKGDFEFLKAHSKEFGFEAIQIDAVEMSGERVSSTNIRKCIMNKDFETAAILLGKKYFVTGTVCYGNQLGRTMGFPTANIIPDKNKLLPPDGVYITTAEINGNVYKSLTNIGKNPTVNGTTKTVETFMFDFDKDIYNSEIKVNFHKFLRNEIKFENIDKLKKQLESDKLSAEKYFKKITS